MQRGFGHRKPHQSTDRFPESGQFHRRKIQPEVPVHHAKQEKFQRHPHARGTDPVESQYHSVHIGYQLTIVTTYRVRFLDRPAMKLCAFDIQTGSLNQRSMIRRQQRSHHCVPAKHLLLSVVIYRFHH